MHRGSHSQHYRVEYDSYDGREYKDDPMVAIVQQFKEFKPYLKRKLAAIKKQGREKELADDVEDIVFYLEVMQDILADETHGASTLRGYIDKIHEMIRKDPTPISDKREPLDPTGDLNDDDHPRSPSPEARGSDSQSNNPRLIPTQGDHGTNYNFASRKEPKLVDGVEDDDWSAATAAYNNTYTRRDNYRDVDMRQGGYYDGPSSSYGRGGGYRGRGRGLTTSLSREDYRRRDYSDDDNTYSDYKWLTPDPPPRPKPVVVKKEEEKKYVMPPWMTDPAPPPNGNRYDEYDWKQQRDSRDSGSRSNYDRRTTREEDEWNAVGDVRSRTEMRDDRHHQPHYSQPYERRTSSETRREERNDEFYYERRPRSARPHESSTRPDTNNSPADYNHGPSHSHGRRREEDDGRHMRGRMDGQYPPHVGSPNMMPPMTSIHNMGAPPQATMGYTHGLPQHQMHYNSPPVMSPHPPHYPGVAPPLLPLPVPNAPPPRMNLPRQNVPPPLAANVSHPMGFQPSPVNNFVRPERHGSPASFTHIQPPPQAQPQTSRPPPPHHHPTEPYHGGSPGYASPVESTERVREISMLKAKQCFGRTVSRPPPSGPPPQVSPVSSTVTTAPSGPLSPKTVEPTSSKGVLDPRLNRISRIQGSQIRQKSPPASSPTLPAAPSPAPARPDAGNVLRADPRSRNRNDEGRRKLMDTRDRLRDLEANRKNPGKPSKIQELRKQFEKEGLHRLGRPSPKKPSGSFEDAIGYANEVDAANKPNEKAKSRSPSKEKESEDRHHGRSHSDKTDREKCPKKSEEKNKSKDKSNAKDVDSEKKKEKDKSGRKKSERNKSTKNATSTKGSKNGAASDNQDKGSQQNKLAGFKIPRKPKPVPPPEPETPPSDPIPESVPSTSNKSGHEISTSPPASPEPALTQVPDVESRTDDAEPSTSTKPTPPPAANTVDSINPDALEFLKQFLITTMKPEEREHILGNQDNLKDFFIKIKTDLLATKDKKEDSASVQSAPVDGEKSVPESEDPKERGRSREKRKNSKRRSSLEKLHDALKEMRFDTMLPLGPRRCTRGGQEDAAAVENVEAAEPALPVPPPIVEPSTSTSAGTEEVNQRKRPPPKVATRKRGRPPKAPTPKKGAAKKKGKAVVTLPPPPPPPPEEEEEEQVDEVEIEDPVPTASAPGARKGRKRKVKPKTPSPNKRLKKSGPVTRAQAALKRVKEKCKELLKKPIPAAPPAPPPENPHIKKTDEYKRLKPNKSNKMLLRRMGKKHDNTSRITSLDTVVNTGLGKIKMELDYTAPPQVKPEPAERLLDTSATAEDSDCEEVNNFADQLDNIINENFDNDIVINMDKQIEENMDLDVFNTLDTDEQENVAKDDLMDVDSSSETYFDNINASLTTTNNNGVADEPINNSQSAPNREARSLVPGTRVESPISSSVGNVQNVNQSQVPSTSTDNSNILIEKVQIDEPAPNPSIPSNPTIVTTTDETVSLKISTFSDKPPASSPAPLSHEEEESRTPNSASNIVESPEKEKEGKKENASPSEASSRSVSPATTTSSGDNVATSNDDESTAAFNIDSSDVKCELDLVKGVFKCDQCSYSGKKIVSHYVNKHAQCNIPQARLMQETFNGLIEMNTSQSPQLLEIILDEEQTQVWPCLYCDDRYSCVADFYDHLTSHTGEFRYECGECKASYPYQKSLVNHVKLHKGVAKNCIKVSFEAGVGKGSKELSGFLCNDCYYFQLRFESIIRHIEQTGHSSLDVKSVRLIRPNANSAVSDSSTTSGAPPIINEVPEKLPEVSSLPIEQSKEDDDDDKNKELPQTQEPVIEKETECIFFGTDVNFSPPSITLNECSLAIEPVFTEKFLDGLLKKVHADDTESQTEQREEATRTNKRKQEDSDNEQTEQSGVDSKTNTTTAAIPTLEEEAMEEDAKCAVQKIKTIHNFYYSKANSARILWDATADLGTEEPNDFFLSSDESCDDSDSDDELVSDSDVSIMGTKSIDKDQSKGLSAETPALPIEEYRADFEDGLRNNEHLLKNKHLPVLELERSWVRSRRVVPIRRAGDLLSLSTVLFGYIMPQVSQPKNAPRLRDSREIEKLGGIFGRRAFPVKNIDRLQEMILNPKLVHLFKCMATHCSYTTDSAPDFHTHLNIKHYRHKESVGYHGSARFYAWRETKMFKDADCCAYCSARYKHSGDLVDHVINQHAQSLFQCSRCFYRSFYHRYVVRHSDMAHPDEPAFVLKCPRKVDIFSQEATLFQIFVYKCDIDNPTCDKTRRFVFREDFLEHLEKCNLGDPDFSPCHLCKKSWPKDEIIEHYKEHNLFKYHCSYCQFGSEVKSDLDDHFVSIHPNTSGRVFYRVKPAPAPLEDPIPIQNQSRTSNLPEIRGEPEPMDVDESSNSAGGIAAGGVDGGPMDISENEDSEKGRVTNLKGRDLYRCVTGDCDFTADESDTFKAHVTSCGLVAESRSLACAHCERKMKTVTNLLEHMKVHGEKKQSCSLCNFRSWTGTEVTKHIKTVHRVMNYKLIKKELSEGSDPDVVAFAKDVAAKMCTAEAFANNYYLFTRKALYSFDNIDKLPQSKVFSSDLYCALCPYSTKVRSNIVRHLTIHKKSLEDGVTVVPQAPRINPVPYLSRESLEFDKMMNLAASSHKTDGSAAKGDEVRKLPQFVKEQFRYVCSVCDHMTSDDGLLQTHIKVIHSEVNSYRCPHCQKNPGTKDNPEYIVSLDKIAYHLRLHGPKLYKCGHCMVVHHQIRAMEKHIPEKHPEKKPIHYLIRDVDPDGIPSSRHSASGIRRHSAEDSKGIIAEKWKCFLCSSKSVFGAWEEIKAHCESVHKVNSQFMCLVCDFASDDVSEMLTHCQEKCKSVAKDKILVMFSKCETFDDDSTSTMPMWKKHGGAVRHIHGNFTEDSVALIKHYNSQQASDSNSLTNSPLKVPSVPAKPVAKPTSTAKARRSTGPNIPKINVAKTILTMPLPPSPPKLEVFKYHCHKCDMYKTKHPSELRIHLFNEFRYKRWKCLVCNLTFTTEKSLKGHIERDHQKIYQPDLYYLQPPTPEIEAEIDECIERQNRKKDLINSFAIEKFGKLSCRHCKEEGLTYATFETHILQKHSG